jgi:uncharacterized membrane protein YdjX (TVP38/TMEM64 family)
MFVIFVLLVIFGFVIYDSAENQVHLLDFQTTAKELGLWAPIVFILFYIVGVIFLPSTPFMVLAGILFGFKLGFIYSLIGSLVSANLVFKISRHLGKEWVENILQKKYLRKIGEYNQKLENKGVLDLVVLRILPIMPFNVLNILMGVSRINIQNYMLGNIIGLLPSIIITVYFGNLLVKLF